MGLFFIYILKASVCLALFYLFYKVLLSKETFHRFNRLALLTVSDLESLLMLAELNAGTEAAETVSRFGWQEAMVSIYLIGAFCCCIKRSGGYVPSSAGTGKKGWQTGASWYVIRGKSLRSAGCITS